LHRTADLHQRLCSFSLISHHKLPFEFPHDDEGILRPHIATHLCQPDTCVLRHVTHR
jgi:hypothetical protein